MTLLTFLCCHVNRFAAWCPRGRIVISTEALCDRPSVQCFVTVLHYHRTVWAATVFVPRNSCANVIRWHSDKTKHHKGGVTAGVWCWWCWTDGVDAAKSSSRRLFMAWSSGQSNQRLLGIGVLSWFQSSQIFLLIHTIALPISWLRRLLLKSPTAVAKTFYKN